MSYILDKYKIFSEISEQIKQNIKYFHVFDENVLFITLEDQVFAFGNNNSGQCGFGHNNTVRNPIEVQELSGKKVVRFFIGKTFVIALNAKRQVYGWGHNSFGQLAVESPPDQILKPHIITSLVNIIEISCGSHHILALNTNGYVYGWGSNDKGQVGCGKGDNQSISRPTQLKSLSRIKSIHTFTDKSFAISSDGLVYSWGSINCSNEVNFEPKLLLELSDITSVFCSSLNIYYLTNEGEIHFTRSISDNPGESQETLESFDSELKFTAIQSMDSNAFVSTERQIYSLDKNTITETNFRSFSELFLNKFQKTFETQLIHTYYDINFDIIKQLYSTYVRKVDKCKEKRINEIFAVKIIKIESNEMEEWEKNKKEFSFLFKCNQDFVVKCFGSWIQFNKFYIQMECYEYTLNDIIEEKEKCFGINSKKAMTLTEYFICCHISKELLECVQYLHSIKPKPIMHRDLKPGNIFVNLISKNGRFIKLGDFGEAIFGSYDPITLTKDVGTWKYIAWEVRNGIPGVPLKSRYNIKADIFSLGVIICDLLDYDVNDKKQLTTNNESFKEKWQNFENFIEKMIENKYDKRPTCDGILNDQNSWLLTESTELHSDSDDYLIEMDESKFFYHYFSEKVLKLNEKFDFFNEISSGSFGKVFKVRDRADQCKYALKIIQLRKAERQLFLNYQKELRRLGEDSEDYFVKYHYLRLQFHPDEFFLQMELCSDNLKNMIENKRICFSRDSGKEMSKIEYFISSGIMIEILECVQYLHEMKPNFIIHRNLKPNNILLNYKPKKNRFIKLSDIGLADFDSESKITIDMREENRRYVAPEVDSNISGSYSPSSDVYSLGKIFCYLFDFDSNSNTESEELKTKRFEFGNQIQRMLSDSPEQRPGCDELLSLRKLWSVDGFTETEKTSKEYQLIVKQMEKFKNQFFINYFSRNETMTKFNNFEFIGELGFLGLIPTVMKVKDKRSNELFALKILRMDHRFDSHSNYWAIKQIELLSKLNNQYVVKFYDSWIEDNIIHIQMELCSDNLNKIIEEKRKCFAREYSDKMSIIESFISSQLMRELLECVQYLHEMNSPIIHRDLKPTNILVNYQPKDGRFLKLASFGCATFDSDDSDPTWSHTRMIGTMRYMAPEVVSGSKDRSKYNTKADIYSLGQILCDLFNYDINERPDHNFNSKTKKLEETINQMMATKYRERPSCSQLLENFEIWGINEIPENEKKSEEYKQNLKQMTEFENQFFINYFNEKLKLQKTQKRLTHQVSDDPDLNEFMGKKQKSS